MPGYTPTNRKEKLKASDLKLRADALIAADSYNLTPNFFEKNKEVFEKINESVKFFIFKLHSLSPFIRILFQL